MKLGIGTMLPLSRSPIRLACIAALVLSGIVTHVSPIVAGDEIISGMNAPLVEKHVAGHHHHVASQKHHNEKKAKHSHISAIKKKANGHLDAIDLHSHNKHGRHVHHSRHHHRHRHGHYLRKHHHHRKHGKKGHHGHKKHHHGKHHGKHHDKHKHKHCDKDKECVRDEVDASKPRIASFGILICQNKTISAIYCPTGTLMRPGAELRTLAQLSSTNIPDALAAMNNNMPKPIPFVNNTFSKTLAFYDVIEMQAPCPSPAYADIAAALKQLTCSDRKLMSAMFNMHYYGTEKMMNLELRNTGGGGNHNNCSHNHWADKCTSTGTFCGIDLFGCNTIDDGLYSCATIGQKPSLLEICPLGGCVPVPSSNGPSHCRHGDCVCAGTGQVCGSEFPPSCKFDDSTLYFCKGSNSVPIALHKCPTGECPKGATECPTPPIDDTCLCKGAGSYEMGSLYTCTGKGEKPTVQTRCESLSCPSGQTACEPTPNTDCKCQKPGPICGASFPAVCELDAGKLYTCADKGDKPTGGEKCKSNSCPAGNAKCDPVSINKDCYCKTVGKICGSSFPAKCGYDSGSLYFCAQKDLPPASSQKCPSNSCKAGNYKCDKPPIPEKCRCKGNKKICGSSFPAECGWDAASLYECRGIDDTPALVEKCPSNSCTKGNDHCDTEEEIDKCKCKAVGQFCGSDFPATCGLHAAYLYSCESRGDFPKVWEMCKSNSCPKDAGKCDPPEPTEDCKCKKAGKICGSSFPLSCALDAGTLFKCSATGADPEIAEKCISNNCLKDRDQCEPGIDIDVCKCSGKGFICGSSFPMKCNLDAASLYKCEGRDLSPVLFEKCESNSCTKGGSKCDNPTPIDDCKCKATGTICSDTFPPSCALVPKSLYDCVAGGDPTILYTCKSGSCNTGSTSCEVNECQCTAEQDLVCGSFFPAKCKLNPAAIYVCTGNWTNPVLDEECESGSCPADASKCDPGPCDCPAAGDICGATFPKICELSDSALYKCENVGSKPKVIRECSSKECLKNETKCTVGECACKGAGDVCGSDFPPNCKYDDATLYTCEAKDEDPTFKRKCASGSCPKGSGECETGDCSCKAVGDICGASFPKSCRYNDFTLYKCDAIGDTPQAKDICLSHICEKDDTKCGVSPCACNGEKRVCGSEFPSDCGYATSGIYTCGGIGTTPIFDHICSSGSCNKVEHHCDPDTCDCKRVGPICGSSFDATCGYVPAALYQCDEIGERPQPFKSCKSKVCEPDASTCGEDPCVCKVPGKLCGKTYPEFCGLQNDVIYSCLSVKSEIKPNPVETCVLGCDFGADKCIPTNPCLCDYDGRKCGASFPDSCGYSKDKLYDCVFQKKPEFYRDCVADSCPVNGTNCNTIDNICLCKKPGMICGSSFPSRCMTNRHALYRCDAEGSRPIFDTKCPSGSCPVDSDACSDLKFCKCEKPGDVCGSTFDEACGLAKGTLYSCAAANEDPIEKEVCDSKLCKSGEDKCSNIDECACTKTGQICGSAFDESCPVIRNALYFCADEGDAPKYIDGCYTGECLPDANQCSPDPCLCTERGSTCGANFPERCKFEAAAVYYCPKKGVRPIFAQNCDTGACPAGQKICTPKPEECTCFKPGQLCGSTFPASCGLNVDTLYYCAGKGEIPKEIEVCKAGTCPYGAKNCERLLDCYCKKGGFPCGKEFPKECRLEADTQYQCSNAGDVPIPIKTFPPGQCGKGDSFDHDPCACSGTGTVCGYVLDLPSCPNATFEDQSIYSCVNNRKPVKTRECTGTDKCVQVGPKASCKADPCACVEEGAKVCGFGIDPSCGTIDKEASYVCSAGVLVKDTDCPKGCLAYEGICNDNCVCEKDGMVCGKVFTGCNLDPNTLYLCQKGKRPTKVRDCHPSSCQANALTTASVKAFTAGQYADTCDANPCYCDSDDSLVCGDKVNPVCKFDPTAIISCPGDGGKPIIVKTCDPNKCITKDGMTRCDTSSDKCRCPSDGAFCGSYFPKECRLPSDAVFSCTGEGKLPIKITTCFPQICDQVDTDAFCEPDPCVCSKNNGTVCSGDFPKICGFQADTVMTCISSGQRPKDFEVCSPNKCTATDGSARCDNNPCLCNEKREKICGSAFPNKCELKAEAIYECKGPMTKPELISECGRTERCDNEGPAAKCDTNKCFCYADEIGKTKCGSEFPNYCYYDNKVIYSCDADNTEWTVKRPCGPDNLCLPAASDSEAPTCSQDGCVCKAEDVGKDFCGSNFPTRCYLLDDTIVTCKTEGDRPEAKEMCSPNKCVFNAKDVTATCKNKECTCKAGQKTACGSSWPSECLYEANMIYECDGVDGTLPQIKNSCKPALCVFDGDKAKCKSTPCQCNEEDITLCGSDFVKDCGYEDNTIFTCSGEGSTPVLQEKCPKQCVHSMVTNTSRCIGGTCDCPRIGAPKNFCGALFPAECNYDNNTVYHCEASGETPTVLEKCTDSGKECALTGVNAQSCVEKACECKIGLPRQCGADFLPSCKFDSKIVYSCKDPKNPVPEVSCEKDCNPSPAAHCEEDVCACKEGVALMCSSEFPDTCGYDKDSVYRCLEPRKPTKQQDCTPNKCVSTPEAHCFVDPCACKASQNLVCGSDFPTECKLKSDAVYKCYGLKYPTLSEECTPGVCLTTNGIAGCRNEDCYCKDGVKTTCSDAFPAVCQYGNDPAQIFRCSGAGSKPSVSVKCKTQCIPNVAGVSVQCKPDPCDCSVELVGKKLCASQFLPSCGLSAEKIYYCGTLGDAPTEVDDCKAPAICEVKEDVGTCKPPVDPCNCPLDGTATTICGSNFESKCGLEPDSVYDCKDKAGRKPVKVTSCAPQACVPGKNSAECDKDPCRCTAAKITLCGGSLPPQCNYNPNVLYFCSDIGSIPTVFTNCTVGGCDPQTSACKTDPCACTSSSSACGSAFPTECQLDPNTLFACDRAGALPKEIEKCTAGCTKGASVCNVDPCVCTKAELKCGSAFDASCKLDSDTLFECAAKGDKPKPKETCIKGGCPAGTTACVKDPCKCGTAPSTCGGDFDASCKFEKDTIYECSGEGATPKPGKKCGTGLCSSADKMSTASVATCKPDCTCKINKDTCGIDFPAECNFPKDTLYTCTKIGDTPKKKEVCALNGCKTGTNKCYVDPCACKVVGEICGKNICATLNPDTIYICNAVNGVAIPKPNTADCGDGKCNGGRCGENTCICTEDGPFCGNELPCPGLNPDLYYNCGKGMKPFPFDRCKNGKPTTGKCLCNDGNSMCSTYFPFECGYEQSQIFDCPKGAGGKPVAKQQCGEGRCTLAIKCDEDCKCQDANSKCGKNFDPKCNYVPGSIYTCSGKGATPVEGKACGSAELCDSVSGVGKCFGECKCKSYEPVCGAAFPESCKFKPGSLYQCDFGGADPARPTACQIPCNPQHGPDKCGSNLFNA
ncbi:hypothetical protein BGZ91_006466 [Linnemannia elongata]|nr:hypothetical protein BGZ91_006466 [Linnemannia elongata]